MNASVKIGSSPATAPQVSRQPARTANAVTGKPSDGEVLTDPVRAVRGLIGVDMRLKITFTGCRQRCHRLDQLGLTSRARSRIPLQRSRRPGWAVGVVEGALSWGEQRGLAHDHPGARDGSRIVVCHTIVRAPLGCRAESSDARPALKQARRRTGGVGRGPADEADEIDDALMYGLQG